MTVHIRKIEAASAPKAIGPYSQGVVLSSFQKLLFVSGQLPVDPKTGKLIEGDIDLQTKRVIDNLEAVLEEAGSGLQQVLRVDIFLKNLRDDFSKVNEEYSRRFTENPLPARQTIQAAELPMNASIEMSCIAYIAESL